MNYLFVSILLLGVLLANVSCSSNCPDTVIATVDASKDTIFAMTSCPGYRFATANVTVEGFQNDSSGFTIFPVGPLHESTLRLHNHDRGTEYELKRDSVWFNSGWMDAFHDTLYVIYRNKNVTKGQLKFTMYYYTMENDELVKKLPK